VRYIAGAPDVLAGLWKLIEELWDCVEVPACIGLE